MRIAVIGSGAIGSTMASLWAEAGHEVTFGSRNPSRLAKQLANQRPIMRADSIADAAEWAEVIFTAFPYGAWPDLAPALADAAKGKVLIDAANPYPARDGAFGQAALDAGDGSGVPIAALLPGVRLVRAFSTVWSATLKSEAHRTGEPLGIPVAGDDPDAVRTAVRLASEAGFKAVQVGTLRDARRFDPGAAVYDSGMNAAEVRRALGVE